MILSSLELWIVGEGPINYGPLSDDPRLIAQRNLSLHPCRPSPFALKIERRAVQRRIRYISSSWPSCAGILWSSPHHAAAVAHHLVERLSLALLLYDTLPPSVVRIRLELIRKHLRHTQPISKCFWQFCPENAQGIQSPLLRQTSSLSAAPERTSEDMVSCNFFFVVCCCCPCSSPAAVAVSKKSN